MLRGSPCPPRTAPSPQATEPIIDTAIASRRPFAVVPCCVFPLDGSRMSFGEWVTYLASKHPNIQSTFLNFAGKNRVLYLFSYDAAAVAGRDAQKLPELRYAPGTAQSAIST